MPQNGEDEPRASATPDQVPRRSSALPAPRSAASAPVDPELAAFRSRLDEQLARRRRPVKALPASAKPGALAALARALGPLRLPNALWQQPGWLTVAPFAACLVAAAIVWWFHRDAVVPTAGMVSISQAGEEPAAFRQALQNERDKVEQLSDELATVWRQLTAQTLAVADQAAQQRELDDLRQALQQAQEVSATYEHLLDQERQRGERLEEQLAASALATAARREPTEDDDQMLEEIKTLRNTLRLAEERSADQQRVLAEERERYRSIEQQIAALRESLRQAREQSASQEQLLADERGRIRLLEAEIAARRQSIVVISQSPAQSPALAPVLAPAAAAPTSGKAVLLAGPPAAAVTAAATSASDDADVPRLMTRARLLLAQGDVGAARIVLERAAEGGNALALFALAETFDPAVLSGWGTMGTQGDVVRARDLYARAFAEGVLEAKERLAAMK